MNDPRYWLVYVACFLGVIAFLIVASAVQEFRLWRKERDRK